MHALDWLSAWHIGDIASLLGLVGLGLTFWQVLRAKTISEEVRRAVGESRREFTRKVTATDLDELIQELEHIKELQRMDVRALLPKRYTVLRRKLISIRASHVALTSKQRSALQETIGQLAEMERLLDKLKGDDSIDYGQLNLLVNAEINRVTEVLAILENKEKHDR